MDLATISTVGSSALETVMESPFGILGAIAAATFGVFALIGNFGDIIAVLPL